MDAKDSERHEAQRSAPKLGQLADDAKGAVSEAAQLAKHTMKVKSSWEKRLHQAAADHPYLSLSGAGAAGFVAGGGLTFMLTRRLWLVGARLAMSFALQQLSQSDMVHNMLGAQKSRR